MSPLSFIGAVEDGYRESAESWKTVLRELKAARNGSHRLSRWVTERWASGPQRVRFLILSRPRASLQRGPFQSIENQHGAPLPARAGVAALPA